MSDDNYNLTDEDLQAFADNMRHLGITSEIAAQRLQETANGSRELYDWWQEALRHNRPEIFEHEQE